MSESAVRNPLFRPQAILLAMLSLSIGWGIRGNFGHEFGAMLPGCLCGIAVCLMSGRADWQRRVLFFALFGAIGWAFGGSMSYMQVISYTQSGHLPSVIYGFFGAFMIGFLWAALGGAGSAYPAVENRERLTALFKPMIVVFVLWGVLYFTEDRLAGWYMHFMFGPKEGANGHAPDLSWFRQKSPFYWLDSDWLQAFLALVAVCIYDLCNRWFDERARDEHGIGFLFEIVVLIALPVAGAFAGRWVQETTTANGSMDHFLNFIVQPQGDPKAPIIDNSGNLLKFNPPLTEKDFVTNWPQFFFDRGTIDIPSHLGTIFGLLIGLAAYFAIYGRWRSGSSLILWMALGWFIGFLCMPVFLSPFFPNIGGFRMTPPRSDNWAGVLGLWVAVLIWMAWHRLKGVNLASVVCGIIGGFALMGMQFTNNVLTSFGNRGATSNPDVLKFWAHWQSANWHSILREQGAGMIYGLGVVIALGLLVRRTPRVSDDPPVHRWTEAFSVFFLLDVLLYVNMVKMVKDWTEQHGGFRAVPLDMKMPLIQSIHMSAEGWFNLMFLLLGLCTLALLVIHMYRPLLVVPSTWTGKGSLLYLIFLWAITIANFVKALVSFTDQRLATEGTIFVNSIICTFLILAFARGPEPLPEPSEERLGPLWAAWVPGGIAAMIMAAFFFTAGTRAIYGDVPVGGPSFMNNMRFGERADWWVKPNIKNKEHR